MTQILRQLTGKQIAYILLSCLALFLIFHLGTDVGVGKASISFRSPISLAADSQEGVGARTKEEDVHMKQLDHDGATPHGQLRRNRYPARVNMGQCPRLFGNVHVFVAVVESSYKT